jgi:DeoR/GlpR family transcriptional regulator of sugar metabolism
MKDQHDNKTVDWVDDPNRSRTSFEKRMDILIFAIRASKDITVKSIFENVLDCTNMTIRACLKDLVKSGYLEQTSIWTYRPTERAKQLFGVKS